MSTTAIIDPSKLTRKDFTSDQEVRWCPGCEDYSILAQLQRTLPTLGIPKHQYVFISGIGCSSRLPYYMATFGMHTIHGRAPAIATGVKMVKPELSVWVATGDGDGLSIGGNHLMHVLRRNVGLKILLFNNRIYGLTKGQMSPTSELNKNTKSTPDGSVDHPVDPISLALGSGATFAARALATDSAGMQEIIRRASAHPGTAFIEIYQNCPIFNDGAFDFVNTKETHDESQLRLVHGKPLRFGKDGAKALALDGNGRARVVPAGTPGELVHDEGSESLAYALSRLGPPDFPTPLGVFRAVEQPTYEAMVHEHLALAKAKKSMNMDQLLRAGETWTVG